MQAGPRSQPRPAPDTAMSSDPLDPRLPWWPIVLTVGAFYWVVLILVGSESRNGTIGSVGCLGGCIVLGYLAGRLTARFPGAMSWAFLISSLIFSTFIIHSVVHPSEKAGEKIGTLLVMLFPFVAGVGWNLRPKGEIWGKPQIRVVFALGLIVACLAIPWPFHVAFSISRPALDRLADRVARGESIPLPARAGIYTIVAAEKVPNTDLPFLLIDDGPGGSPSGFVRGQDPHLAIADSFDPKRPGWWIHSPLDSGWFYRRIDTNW